MCAWDAAKGLRHQLRQTPEQHVRAVSQRTGELSTALMLLEQDLAVVFNEIHDWFPSGGGWMPAASKDVSVFLVRAHVIAPIAHTRSTGLYDRCRGLRASDAEPGDDAGPKYGEVTHPLLLALRNSLRFAGQLTSIHLLILSRSGMARFAERTLPLLVQCNMYPFAG
jgi:hypothetical protein